MKFFVSRDPLNAEGLGTFLLDPIICQDYDPAALDIAREYGFARSRELLRMVRKGSVPHDASLGFAIAGFEFG